MKPSHRASVSVAPDPLIGRVVDGRFTLQLQIGRGGMGLVYRAQQAPLERPVALKILAGGGPPDREAEFQRRFFREAATAAKLKHPNTITVFDYGSDTIEGERYFFIAMELLDGITLTKALRSGPMPLARVLNISLQVCRSLAEAHGAGLVHRDLKPGNIMLIRQPGADDSERDFAKVLDFGLAKSVQGDGERRLTRAGTFLGSPRYVAPEQIEGRPVDPRADIYAFGCVLYRMLTGRVPFDGATPQEIMMRHLEEEPPAMDEISMPPRLRELVRACLQKDAGARPADMPAVVAALQESREALRIGARPLPDGDSSRLARARSPEGADAARGGVEDRPPLTPAPSGGGARDFVAEGLGEQSLGELLLDETTRPTTLLHAKPARSGLRWGLAGLLWIALGGAGVLVGEYAGWWRPVMTPALTELVGSWRGRPVVVALEASPGLTTASPPARSGAMAATLQIMSEPPGARVVEVTEWGTEVRGVTPLHLPWAVSPQGPPRRFWVEKEGFRRVKAQADPPPENAKPPILLRLPIKLERVPESGRTPR